MAKETKSKKGPRMWKCGDDFANPIPAGSEADSDSEIFGKNHWKIVFDEHRDEDQKQCEIWKDEVNILLIFAGLFSAVVTAFLIESYKFLLPQDGSLPDKFGPDSPHIIRLNSLWFCSLVLSLSTVVIGLVALQWIRNHQRYHGIKPRDALSVYEMRTKALRAWHIRWTFLCLPLLILVALILFFVGLVDFLLSLNKKVAAPVAALVYPTLAFLFFTTILPSGQIFWLYISKPNIKTEADMPTPCPYKSAQSLIFHRFLSFLICHCRDFKRWIYGQGKAVAEKVSFRDLPMFFTFYASPNKWTDHDTNWLRLRDTYSQVMEGNHKQDKAFLSGSLQHPRRPIYDESRILKDTVIGKLSSPSADVLFAAYHCFQEISKNALYQGAESKADYADPQYNERNVILRGYYWKHIPRSRFGPPISDLVQDPSPHLLHDENMSVFLQMHSPHNLPEKASRIISAHLSELQVRILAYIYAAGPARHFKSLPSPVPAKGPQEITSKTQWLYVLPQQYIDMINSTQALPNFKIWSQFSPIGINGTDIPVSHGTIRKTIIQYSMIFTLFVQNLAELNDQDWQGSVYTHQNVAQFVKVTGSMLRYRESTQNPFDVLSHFEDALRFIEIALTVGPNTNSESSHGKTIDHKSTDYLFLIACVVIEQLFHPYSTPPLQPFEEIEQCMRMADFIKVLDAYEETHTPARIKQHLMRLWHNTDLPKEPAFKFKYNSSRISYIRWNYIPGWIEEHLAARVRPARSLTA